jgi:Na+-translocating ferredoxin:NAD+ oxidoreductase subunit B
MGMVLQAEVLFAAIFMLGILGTVLGFALGYAAKFFKVEQNPLVDKVIGIMPGSNCGQCGYPGCTPAAEAIVNFTAPPTCCPPGGKVLAQEIAQLLNISLDLSKLDDKPMMLAQIDENTCIGCARCTKKCPTDAIVGASKYIHAVIQDACTGCEACIDICPTKCLQMHPIQVNLKTWRWDKPKLDLAA